MNRKWCGTSDECYASTVYEDHISAQGEEELSKLGLLRLYDSTRPACRQDRPAKPPGFLRQNGKWSCLRIDIQHIINRNSNIYERCSTQDSKLYQVRLLEHTCFPAWYYNGGSEPKRLSVRHAAHCNKSQQGFNRCGRLLTLLYSFLYFVIYFFY